jgi:hypothetical protein
MRSHVAWAALIAIAACGYKSYDELFVAGQGGSANTGGRAQTGGAAGQGGSARPNTGGSAGSFAIDLIDSMEQDADGGSALPRVNGRTSGWFTYNDGTTSGWQEPRPGAFRMASIYPAPRDGSQWAARTFGNGFTSWGSSMGLNLKSGAAYDASAYAGVVFYAMVGDQAPTSSFRIAFPEPRTVASSDPSGLGACSSQCWDHFGKDIEPTKTWTSYTVLFAEARQIQPIATPAALDATHLIGISFELGPSAPFDLWIDDIAFVCKNASCAP